MNQPTPHQILRKAGMGDGGVESLISRHAEGLSNALAMNLAAFYERLIRNGIPPEDATALTLVQSPIDVSAPHERADAATRFVQGMEEAGVDRKKAWASAIQFGSKRSSEAAGLAPEALSQARRTAPGASEITNPRPLELDSKKEWNAMNDQEHRNETDVMRYSERERERVARERERLERERERLEQEHERASERLEREQQKLEHEQKKLERLQEEIETRIERQQERLEELLEQIESREEELEAREEELEEAAEELEGLEVEGAEGVREVLDVVSQQIPTLMRGIQESVYSPEAMKAMADSFSNFFKSLVEAGIDPDEATEMTKLQMLHIQSQSGFSPWPGHSSVHGGRRRTARPARPARPARNEGPASETNLDSEEDDDD